MSGKKTNYYNVVKDGKLIAKEVTNQKVAELSGCDAGQVSTYAVSKNIYHGKDGAYRFIHMYSKYTEPKPSLIREKLHASNFSADEIRRWNDMIAAANLIRSGKGKIVAKRVKGKIIRYTEAIG